MGESSPVQAAAAEVFRTWESLMVSSLEEHRAGPEEARGLATLIVASAEGAVAMCRAQRDTVSLDRIGAQLLPLVRSAVGD